MAAPRHRYTKDELDQYFDRISLPRSKRIYDVSSLPDTEQLAFLEILQKHHLVKVPWENVTQHYSWHRVVNVKPKHLFKKIVHSPGRGGYCMEVNLFHHFVLYSLNFAVYLAGSRIYATKTSSYGGWTHVINVVTINSVRYLLDGGFGPQGPTRPLALEPGVLHTQISPAQMRLVYECLPEHLDRNQRVWIYQWRPNDTAEFVPMYCFVDLEFTPMDVESMNFAPYLNPRTFFTHSVVANRFTTDRERDDGPRSPDEAACEGEINGALTLNQDVLKWRQHGKAVLVVEFKTDQERVEHLERYFGITLAEEDREAIVGAAAFIGPRGMGTAD